MKVSLKNSFISLLLFIPMFSLFSLSDSMNVAFPTFYVRTFIVGLQRCHWTWNRVLYNTTLMYMAWKVFPVKFRAFYKWDTIVVKQRQFHLAFVLASIFLSFSTRPLAKTLESRKSALLSCTHYRRSHLTFTFIHSGNVWCIFSISNFLSTFFFVWDRVSF